MSEFVIPPRLLEQMKRTQREKDREPERRASALRRFRIDQQTAYRKIERYKDKERWMSDGWHRDQVHACIRKTEEQIVYRLDAFLDEFYPSVKR